MEQGGHHAGEVVGSKELVSYEGRNSHRHHLWTAKCLECGTVSAPSTLAHIKRSKKFCAVCVLFRENNGRWHGYKELTGVWLNQYRADAAKKNREWAVTPEQLWDLWEQQDGRCVYTGWELHHGVDASLDRIDSSVGYIPGNVQWVHRRINFMKSDRTEEEFVALCQAVADHTRRTA